METFDPWNDSINLSTIFKNSLRKELYIYGPLNKKKERKYIKFIFYKNNNLITMSTNENDTDIRVNINLNDESAKINYIESLIKNGVEIYSGTDIMKLLLKILKDINIKKISLIDQSKINCINRVKNPKFMFSNSIPYSIITLLKNNKTLYMKFGFKPYLDNKNKLNNIINNIKLLKNITWEEINYIIENGEKTINYIKNGKNNILSSNIRNLNTWELYWTMIKNSYNQLYFKFKDKYNGPFDAFEKYNIDECQMFINWLELYSLSKYYEKTKYNFYIENGTKHTFIIPYKQEFINILGLLKNSEWIIDNLQMYNSNIDINSLNKLYKKENSKNNNNGKNI